MTKIIIVDDHSLFREGIKLLVENEGLGEVIAEAENGLEFLDLLKNNQPDLVIMDIEMPKMGGLEATQRALKIQPELKVLVLTMLSDKANYIEMINAGALGFVLKTSGKQEFEKAINSVVRGDNYFSSDMLRQLIINAEKHLPDSVELVRNTIALTPREQEVLEFLCKGLTVSEIASVLFLSPKTIEVHRSTLLRKTNAKNTINLVLYAIKSKLVEI